MKISGYGAIGSGSGVKKRGDASQTGSFSDILAAAESEESPPAAPASDIAATAALANLLALQEISDEDIRRSKLLQQGKTMLELLEELRRRLLSGSLPASLMRDLSRQLSIQKQFVADPRLNEIIEDIELRTAVELAKLERAIIR